MFKKFFVTLMLLLCLGFQPVFLIAADEGTVQIDLPSSLKIEHDSDVTAQMFNRLIGDSWGEITGEKSYSKTSGGLGAYSTLIVAILGVVNVASMAFVASSIIYMWGIFAITTAHEGKKLGGSVFNSLWLPVRHAFSFSLTVPVLNGLSLMQIAIITCVALSINFANIVWKASAEYIVAHAHTSLINTTAPVFEQEVFKAVPYMFSDAVAQRTIAEHGLTRNPDSWKNGIWGSIFAGLKEVINFNGVMIDENFDIDDIEYNGAVPSIPTKEIVYIYYDGQGRKVSDPGNHDLRNGLIVVRQTLGSHSVDIYLDTYTGVSENDITKIRVPVAAKASRDGKYTQAARSWANELAQKRVDELVKLWAKLWQMADYYLKTSSATTGTLQGGGSPIIGSTALTIDSGKYNVQKLMDDYNQNMTDFMNKHRDDFNKVSKEKTVGIEKVVGFEKDTTRWGWAGAGLFYYGLAAWQKKIDDEALQLVSFHVPASKARDYLSQNAQYILNDNEKLAIEKAPHFASEVLMKGTSYQASAYSESSGGGSDIMKELVRGFASMFFFPGATDGHEHGGLLGQTLDMFSVYDPIVIMTAFGDRLLTTSWVALTGFSILSFFAQDIIGVGVVMFLLITACFFSYVVPITPVIFWLRALLTWVFMVVEAMVAAPFWVCTHALPEGAGFAGQHAKRGYMMLLNIVCRPTLLVLGAVFAIALVQGVGWLFSTLLSGWFTSIGQEFVGIGILADVSYTIVVMGLMYYLSLTLFTKGINHLPDHVLKWCGSGESGAGVDDMQDTKNIIVAGGAFNQISGQLTASQNSANRLLDKYKHNHPKPNVPSPKSDTNGGVSPGIAEAGGAS